MCVPSKAVGASKTGGNYAASFKATADAAAAGFDQVVWLDGKEPLRAGSRRDEPDVHDRRQVDDRCARRSDLPGVTRDSVLQIVRDMDIEVIETEIDINDIKSGRKEGKLTEAFGTGTAAAISPIGEIHYDGEAIIPGDGRSEDGPASLRYAARHTIRQDRRPLRLDRRGSGLRGSLIKRKR